jgi:hypothetical protein
MHRRGASQRCQLVRRHTLQFFHNVCKDIKIKYIAVIPQEESAVRTVSLSIGQSRTDL